MRVSVFLNKYAKIIHVHLYSVVEPDGRGEEQVFKDGLNGIKCCQYVYSTCVSTSLRSCYDKETAVPSEYDHEDLTVTIPSSFYDPHYQQDNSEYLQSFTKT